MMTDTSPSGRIPGRWLATVLRLLAWCGRREKFDASTISSLSANIRDILPMLETKKVDSLYYLSSTENLPRQRLYDQIWSVQKRTLLDVCSSLTEQSLEFYLFKGSECAERWYNSRALGLFSDVDVLVARHEMGKVKAVLYGEGFRQADFNPNVGALVDRDVAEIAGMEAQHYELAPFSKLVPADFDLPSLQVEPGTERHPLVILAGRPMIVVELDIHHGVATDIDPRDLTRDAQPSALGQGLSFSDSNQLWLLTSRYYTEVAIHGKRSLRDFAYVLPLIACGDLDWDVVLSAARKYGLRSSLYYYLYFMSFLTEGAVPKSVLAELSPDRGNRLHDWGWQLGKLFDLVDGFPLNPDASSGA